MLDEKDRRILAELKKNARESTKKIATTVTMPRVTVHDRIQKMIERGVIASFTVIPDYEKLDLSTTVFIFVASNPCASPVDISDIAHKIASLPNVFEIHIISGEYDLLIKVRGKSFDEVGKTVVAKIRQLKGIGRTFTIPCFTTVKEEF
jgi:DNA-binding Lrp family transcriptional regulator